MKKGLFFILCAILLLFTASCREKGQKNMDTAQNYVATSVTPQWIFNSKEDTLGNPQTQIYLVLKDSVKITEATGSFRILEKQEYAEKNLPLNTISACSGFWAGLEQQFIVVDSTDCWVVKAKYEDEGGEKSDELEIVKVIKK